MKSRLLSLVIVFLLATGTALAQWRTESYTLRAGWNAIYPTVDAGYTTIDSLVAASPDIVEIWRWQPERLDPRLPENMTFPPAGLDWGTWKRGVPEETSFTQLNANYGYLVRLADTAAQQTLSVKGRSAMPEVRWRGDGLNLVGFPVVTTGTRPTFSAYLSPGGFSLGSSNIFRYVGGPIVNNVNPALISPTVSRIERGQAAWVRVELFSRYYGPLKVELETGNEVAFGVRSGPFRVLITNQTTTPITFTLAPAASESAPVGQTAVAGPVPLIAQVNSESAYTALTSRTFTLSPGVIMAVRLAVDRSTLSGVVGTTYGSLLNITTTAGVVGQQVIVPVTAEVGSLAGLWLGEAQITNVGSVAIRYERDAAGNTVYETAAGPNFGKPRVIEDLTTPGGAATLPGVNRPYTLRVMLHVNASGQATLLSHVYSGRLAASPPDAGNGLTTSEALLDPAELTQATRLSVAHLPLDTRLAFTGTFATGAVLTHAAPLVTGYDANDNPFVHRYHPDHDNLDARFATTLAAGKESFDIKRTFRLAFASTPPDGSDPNWGVSLITAAYSEFIEGPYKSPLRVAGNLTLYKVNETAVLTVP